MGKAGSGHHDTGGTRPEQQIYLSLAQGMTTAEVLTSLVARDIMISAVFVFRYHHPPLLQSRFVLSTAENEIIGKACALRSASSLPFWEALMLSCFNGQGDYARLLREATFHQSHRESLRRIPREQVLAGYLVEWAESQPAGENLSFSSLVEIKDVGYRHLPLLDFHCPESNENDRLVTEVCRVLFQCPAFVFSSGKSYHVVGVDFVEESTLQEFLVRSILFAPIVDARYVAHQLLEGVCALRLSCSTEKPVRPWLKFSVVPSE